MNPLVVSLLRRYIVDTFMDTYSSNNTDGSDDVDGGASGGVGGGVQFCDGVSYGVLTRRPVERALSHLAHYARWLRNDDSLTPLCGKAPATGSDDFVDTV